MPIDAELRAMLKVMNSPFPLREVPLEFLRQSWPIPTEPPPALTKAVERTIETRSGRLRVRIYRASSGRSLPVLVYFHGGGFVLGSLDVSDALARHLALFADCVVVSVDYRLAPEAPFPAAVEDCSAAVVWVRENATEFAGDPNRIVVGGDSAGANLAAVAALRARDEGGPKLAGQLLVHPVTLMRAPKDGSMVRNGEGYFLCLRDMEWFEDMYLGAAGDARHPHASPLLADLRRLPPALVITAEFDPLLDQGEAYARRLREAGVECEHSHYFGAIHGFFGMPVEIGRRAVAEACAWLKRTFTHSAEAG